MKKICVFLLCFMLLALPFALAGCDDAPIPDPEVNYFAQNDFDVSVDEDEDALIFSPTGAKASYGLIFYCGTAISPQNYSYLGEALAKQGFLAVIPKSPLGMAFFGYAKQEKAYEKFAHVRFFLGGHSQGGGAAIRRAQENADRTQGLVLFAPLCYTYQNGVFNGGGNNADADFYNVADMEIPSLILEASADRVLSAAQKSAAKECVAPAFATQRVITPGSHMSFSTNDSDSTLKFFNNDGDGMTEQDKQAQRAYAVRYTLDFMINTLKSKI